VLSKIPIMFKQKILCLGNETEDTHIQTQKLADADGTANHGLISDPDFYPQHHGYYHTSVADLIEASILKMSGNFDQIIMLDQTKESYPHFKSFISTFKLMLQIEESGQTTQFKSNLGNKNILYWYNSLRENKRLCYYPFMVLLDNHDNTSLCCKNEDAIKPVSHIKDWQTDPDYNVFREAMLKGQHIDRCVDCYFREDEGQESTRQFETLEAAVRYDLKDVSDLKKFTSPVYYEIRPSNKCNIMCRMCDSAHSHLIEKEWKSIGIPIINNKKYTPTEFDIIDFDHMDRVYVAGGEPTILPEFYDFLRKCIQMGRTNFELLVGTNAMKISDTLLKLLEKFPNVCFSVSVDGYDRINDYIRWGSDFETIRKNTHKILDAGHKVGFQTVFSMYNACRVHEIYEFYSSEFPQCTTLSQVANFRENIMLPYNFPIPEMVLESLYKCTETSVYHGNGRSAKSMVDLMINHYENHFNPDFDRLRKFFEFNDKLDKSRGSNLSDYIPELAAVKEKFL
jgi:uncharacterized Fe-S cluster-containing radical SAM superfamily protein